MERALVELLATESVDTGLPESFSSSAAASPSTGESARVVDDEFGMRHFRRGLGGAKPIVETLSPEIGRLGIEESGGRGKGRIGPGGVLEDDDEETGDADRDALGGTGGSGRGLRFKELSLLTRGSGLSS